MSEFIEASHVFLDSPAQDVGQALDFLSSKAVELGIASDKQEVKKAFEGRESEGTTGMLDGFAIPHAKCDAIHKASVIIVKFANDMAWESLDGKPIKVAISLLVPSAEAGTTHIQLLSKVAVMLMDENFRKQVLASSDKQAIASLINERLESK
ncbi:MAG: fructose PTS transporter subunit IIA [Atopobiaceae bacterium]|jgi:PTS system fructose-specific IIA component